MINRYVWTQTLSGVEVSASVPGGTKSRDIKVDISTNRMNIYLKGQALFGMSHLAVHIYVAQVVSYMMVLRAKTVSGRLLTAKRCK